MAETETVVSIPLKFNAGNIEVDLKALPDDVYRECMLQGLKVILNRGMSKLKKDTEGVKEQVQAIAQENLDKAKASQIKFTGGAKAEKVSGKVKTEAMRLARGIVKDELKKAGHKVSHYAASDITAAAKALLEENPELLEQAKKNLEEREATPIKVSVLGNLKVDAKRVAKAEADAAAKKAKTGLSAKQAGMPAKRKGQPQATAH